MALSGDVEIFVAMVNEVNGLQGDHLWSNGTCLVAYGSHI
jgi:hypothetical protein